VARLIFCFLSILAGCSQAVRPDPSLGDHIGQSCTVQFRRDALGAGADIPVPPTTDAINGASVNITGTLRKAGSDWVVVEFGNEQYFIATHAILLLKFNNQPADSKPATPREPGK
jgi:hypothetical protein